MANLDLYEGSAAQRGFVSADVARLRVIAADFDRSDGDGEIRFRRYRLMPRSRMLLRDGRPLDIGSRAFDLLHVLVSARGAVVSKDDIVRRVWPATVVDECNLRFQIAVLRKALGDDRDLIKTISGRGYLFVADQGVVRLARPEPEDRHWAPASSVMAQSEAAETCETLRSLLRSVLDELWQMTAQAEQVSATTTNVASRLSR